MTQRSNIVVRSTADLADLLNLTDAEAGWIEMRSRLLARIVKEAKRRGLTHAELALAARTSRSRVTAILGGNLKGVSTDLLLRIAGTLGLQPRLTLQRAA